MELSTAEVFLLTWAGVTTISTAWLTHKNRQLRINGLMMLRTLVGVGMGKITVERTDQGIKFEDVEENQ